MHRSARLQRCRMPTGSSGRASLPPRHWSARYCASADPAPGFGRRQGLAQIVHPARHVLFNAGEREAKIGCDAGMRLVLKSPTHDNLTPQRWHCGHRMFQYCQLSLAVGHAVGKWLLAGSVALQFADKAAVLAKMIGKARSEERRGGKAGRG